MMMKIPSRPTAESWSPWTRFRGSMLGRPPRRDKADPAALQATVAEPSYAPEPRERPEAAPSLPAEIG